MSNDLHAFLFILDRHTVGKCVFLHSTLSQIASGVLYLFVPVIALCLVVEVVGMSKLLWLLGEYCAPILRILVRYLSVYSSFKVH